MWNAIKPEDVFTPKGSTVNTGMYIDRPKLEDSLRKAIRKPKHIIIHGESGCGKTWLYKNIFKEQGIKYEVLNSATVITSGCISKAIDNLIYRLKPVDNTGYEEKKSAKANTLIIEGALEHTKKYEYRLADSFYELVKLIGSSQKVPSFLVIENVEHLVLNHSFVSELSALLLYLDDELYSKHNVRILIVGTSSNIRDYFAKEINGLTIVNRVQEIPEVSALEHFQTHLLATKGLFEKLHYKLEPSYHDIDGNLYPYTIDKLLSSISWFTADVPQYIHELCLEIAMNAENNCKTINNKIFYDSLFDWLQASLISEHSRLEQNVNSVETKHGRRNQVIFAMSQLDINEFNYQEIENKVRELFPKSTHGKALNMSGVLSELSSSSSPIIRKVPKGSRYRFIDPRLKIIARWMLVKKSTNDEGLSINKFDDNIKMF